MPFSYSELAPAIGMVFFTKRPVLQLTTTRLVASLKPKNASLIFSIKTLIENQMSECVSEANLPICDGPDNLQQISFYEVNCTNF